jgi:transposase-like protein
VDETKIKARDGTYYLWLAVKKLVMEWLHETFGKRSEVLQEVSLEC